MKTKLNDNLIVKITKLISEGNYIKTACQATGIHPDTFYEWMNRADQAKKSLPEAEQGEDIYIRFSEAVKKAEAECEANIVRTVTLAAPKNWLAGMTYLERKYPDRWAKREVMDINVKHAMQFQEKLVEALQRPQIIDGEYKEIDVQRQIEAERSSETTEAETA